MIGPNDGAKGEKIVRRTELPKTKCWECSSVLRTENKGEGKGVPTGKARTF